MLTVLLSHSVISAALSPQEQCATLGDIAQRASQLRLDGKDVKEALDTLQQANSSGLPEDKVAGAVRVSYMAKMSPDDMRRYYISQCEKDSLR
jgi:hypothetical protein